jgi:hypothetical protein
MSKTMIEGAVIRQTAKAIFANLNGCHSSVWIPRSQMLDVVFSTEDHGDGMTSTYVTASVPVWLWNKMPVNDGPIPYATSPRF